MQFPLPHCARLTASKDFAFKAGGKGRAVVVRKGQRFWVTSSTTLQNASGVVLIDREGKGCISVGWAFDPAQLPDFFQL